jgi:hypothetical protein
MTEVRFEKDVVAIAAIAWADGRMDADEDEDDEGADAIVRASVSGHPRRSRLDLEAIADVEASTEKAVDLDRIDRATPTKADRLYIYGVTCGTARLDGDVSDAESAALGAPGERLGVPERAHRGQWEARRGAGRSCPPGEEVESTGRE